MTTIHLTDEQRDTFAACGLIVIDGETCPNDCTRFDGKVPGHIYGSNWPWVPCQTCQGTMLVAPEGWRILTEPCDCGGEGRDWSRMWDGKPLPCPDCVGGRQVVALTATCPTCASFGACHVKMCLNPDCTDGVVTLGRFTIPALLHCYDDIDTTLIDLPLDPLPRPGQFIARPERVE